MNNLWFLFVELKYWKLKEKVNIVSINVYSVQTCLSMNLNSIPETKKKCKIRNGMLNTVYCSMIRLRFNNGKNTFSTNSKLYAIHCRTI